MTALATPPPLTGAVPRLLTVADLAVLPSELPTGTVRWELDNGRLIAMAPPGYIHARCENHLATQLMVQGEHRSLGRASCGEVAIVLWRNPDRVVGADAVFIANQSLPLRLSPEGYLETIPDLVLEVRSKNDTQPEIDHKVNDYLTAGVRVVWVADPERQTLTVYRSGQARRKFSARKTV